MNKPFVTPELQLWTTPQVPDAGVVPGYEAALQADLDQGAADLDAGRVVSLDAIRKEFGVA